MSQICVRYKKIFDPVVKAVIQLSAYIANILFNWFI